MLSFLNLIPSGQAHFLALPGVNKHKLLQFPLLTTHGFSWIAENREEYKFAPFSLKEDSFTVINFPDECSLDIFLCRMGNFPP